MDTDTKNRLVALYHMLGCRPEALAAKKMTFVDIFKGTGSMSLHARMYGISSIVTLDIEPSCDASFTCDIMDVDDNHCFCRALDDYIKSGTIIIMHASPPCNEFSRMNTNCNRDIDGGMKYVTKAVEIMKKYSDVWCLENPATGLLWSQPFAQEHLAHSVSVDYCAYGGLLKKATTFAFSVKQLAETFNAKQCPGRNECVACFPHHETGNMTHADWQRTNYEQRIAIPPQLCMSIINHMATYALDIAKEIKGSLEQKIDEERRMRASGSGTFSRDVLSPVTKRTKTDYSTWPMEYGDVIIFACQDPFLRYTALNISITDTFGDDKSNSFIRAFFVQDFRQVSIGMDDVFIVAGYNYVGNFERMTKCHELTYINVPVSNMVYLLSIDDDGDVLKITRAKKTKILEMGIGVAT
jgi:hypothetical protein